MYAFILDKSAQDSKNIQDYLIDWKDKHNISSEEIILDNVDNITSFIRDKGEKFTTIVAVGDEKTFEIITSMAKFYRKETVLGYIPTNISTLSKRLGLKDCKQALQVISQRKIIELTALSINNRYFLFSFYLNNYQNTNNIKGKSKVKINADNNLNIDLETTSLLLHNRNQEVLPHSCSILLEAFSNNNVDRPGKPLINITKNSKLKYSNNNNILQLRLPANYIEINSSNTLYDSYGIEIKNPVKIGIHKKTIRLIAKRGQEIQSVMSPGLIS